MLASKHRAPSRTCLYVPLDCFKRQPQCESVPDRGWCRACTQSSFHGGTLLVPNPGEGWTGQSSSEAVFTSWPWQCSEVPYSILAVNTDFCSLIQANLPVALCQLFRRGRVSSEFVIEEKKKKAEHSTKGTKRAVGNAACSVAFPGGSQSSAPDSS